MKLCLFCGKSMQKPADRLDRFPHICSHCELVPDDLDAVESVGLVPDHAMEPAHDPDEQWSEVA